MNNPTFKQSLLIPFSPCKEKEERDPALSILSEKNVPADLKLKQFDSFVKYNRDRKTSDEKTEAPPHLVNLENISDAKKPLAESILTFIRKTPEISWDWKFQLVIDQKVFSGSDLPKILQYLVGELVITNSVLDIPPGARELEEKLRVLGIPSSWLQLIPRRSKRATKRKVLPKEEEEEEDEEEEEEEEIPIKRKKVSEEKKRFKAEHQQRRSARLKKKKEKARWQIY